MHWALLCCSIILAAGSGDHQFRVLQSRASQPATPSSLFARPKHHPWLPSNESSSGSSASIRIDPDGQAIYSVSHGGLLVILRNNNILLANIGGKMSYPRQDDTTVLVRHSRVGLQINDFLIIGTLRSAAKKLDPSDLLEEILHCFSMCKGNRARFHMLLIEETLAVIVRPEAVDLSITN